MNVLHGLLDRRAAATPDARALTRGSTTWTYAELRDRSLAYAAWLARRGVGRGDRVLVVAPHAAESAALAFAASRLGAIFAVISDQIRPYLLEHVLADREPRLVVGTSEAATTAEGLFDGPVHELADLSGARHVPGTDRPKPQPEAKTSPRSSGPRAAPVPGTCLAPGRAATTASPGSG